MHTHKEPSRHRMDRMDRCLRLPAGREGANRAQHRIASCEQNPRGLSLAPIGFPGNTNWGDGKNYLSLDG